MDDSLERAVAVLGPLEGRIMRAIWSGDVAQPFVVRDVQAKTRGLAYTTVMTTLNRLAEKGLLTVRAVPHQRAHEYRSAGSPTNFLTTAGRDEAKQLVQRYGDAALAAFADRLDQLTPTQRERLQRLAGR